MTGMDATADKGRGFAGLPALASTLPPAPSPEKLTHEPVLTVEPRTTVTTQVPVSTSFWTAGRKWIVGVAVVGGVLLLASLSGSPPNGSQSFSSNQAQSYIQQPSAGAANRLYTTMESMPEGRADEILNAPQIRYCLAERIRLVTLQKYTQNGDNAFVGKFNSRVAEFNYRCSNYKYYPKDMDEAQRGITGRESDIAAEALKE